MDILLYNIILLFIITYCLTGFFIKLRHRRDNLLDQLNQLCVKVINLSEAGMKKHGWQDQVNVTTELEAEDFVIIKYGLMPLASRIGWHCLRLNFIPFSFVSKDKLAEYIKRKYQKYLPIINEAYERFVNN